MTSTVTYVDLEVLEVLGFIICFIVRIVIDQRLYDEDSVLKLGCAQIKSEDVEAIVFIFTSNVIEAFAKFVAFRYEARIVGLQCTASRVGSLASDISSVIKTSQQVRCTVFVFFCIR